MADLKTNYVDDKLDSSKNQLRKYQQIKNDDGTVSFVDVTDYTATGTSFGASDINATNTAINKNTADISSLNLKMELVRSHVGMIVQSTTLDTEAKVIAIYGGTSWSKIEGRFLLGASSSYKINSTGGEATHKLLDTEMPSHSHSLTCGGNVFSIYANNSPSADIYNKGFNMTSPGAWTTANKNFGTITFTGGNLAHNNMPPYKAVYIWERTA